MMRRKMSLLLFFVAFIICMPSLAQDKASRDRLLAAHAMYYTPTANGLRSFRCEAAIDWKAMLTRYTGNDIPDDNPFLKYLLAVHLSVADQLNGKGAMEWTDGSVQPEGKEENAKQMHDGLQTAMAGFFQTWNAFMNGSMVPLPDSTLTVTAAEAGVHLSGASASIKFDEDFDENMLLRRVQVAGPDLKVLAIPSYQRTTDGLIISAVTSQINQPPSAPQMEVTFRIAYTTVESFQIPSNIVIDTKNVGVIDISFNSCQVSVVETNRKPAAEKSGQIN
jgi:hypothetical protein